MKHEIIKIETLKISIILLFCMQLNACMKTKLEPGMHMLSPHNQNLRKKTNTNTVNKYKIK
jgi:hypothetical protein